MFAVRGIAVSFSVFVSLYFILSVAVSLSWKQFWLYARTLPARPAADSLFIYRMFPLITAAVITAGFAVPSFLLLEPRAIEEPIGELPLILGVCGTLLGLIGIINAGLALRRASRTISGWTENAEPVKTSGSVPLWRISGSAPAMTATGILRSKVFLSHTAEFLLSATELQTALNHELAHIRRQDNLKKLLLRFTAFPGMKALEEAWVEASEIAADDAAVTSIGEALDLAAALIKLSRLGPIEPATDLTAALLHTPLSIMNARVERLLAWGERRRSASPKLSRWYGLAAAAATIAVCVTTYGHLLVHLHTATEWLVR